MLTLRRFKALAESYGANLARWPDRERHEAETLLNTSAQARMLIDEAQMLDAAIAFAQSPEDTRLWPADEQAAALARLRSGVEARIAARPKKGRARFRAAGWSGWKGVFTVFAGHPDIAGMAIGSAFSIVVGLLIGTAFGASYSPDNLQAMLQAAPLHIFG